MGLDLSALDVHLFLRVQRRASIGAGWRDVRVVQYF